MSDNNPLSISHYRNTPALRPVALRTPPLRYIPTAAQVTEQIMQELKV